MPQILGPSLTFENEDPTPSFVAFNAVHVRNGIGQETGDRAREDRGCVEEVDPPLELVSLVVPGKC